MTFPEKLALQMGLDIPDFDVMGYYGADYGTMKPFHRVGSLLFLSGHVAQVGAEITHKGRLGKDVTTEQGYLAARQTGLNVVGGIRQAVGSLDRVKGIVRSLNLSSAPRSMRMSTRFPAACRTFSSTSTSTSSGRSVALAAGRRSASWRWRAGCASRPG